MSQTLIRSVALVTQMRAGTHYMCAALRIGMEATIYRPDQERQFVIMTDQYISRGLHSTENIIFPKARSERTVHFCHYYHPQLRLLASKPQICLIGFPLDSFYSDAVVASYGSTDPAPSGPRAGSYVMRYKSQEWCFLEEKMRENANWLEDIEEDDNTVIFRYEDLFGDFDASVRRLESFVGQLANPLPQPTKNARRTYWTGNYSTTFDPNALKELWRHFAPAIARFYPERFRSLKDAL